MLLFARVLLRVEEVEDVRVPGLQIDGERARTLQARTLIIHLPHLVYNDNHNSTSQTCLVAALIHVSRGVVEHSKHREKAVRDAVRASDVRAGRADAVHRETDAARVLRDERTLLQRVVDAFKKTKQTQAYVSLSS